MKKLIKCGLFAVGAVVTYEVLRRQGVVDQINGKIKRKIGALTDNKQLEAEGVFDTAKGKVTQFTTNAKEAAEKALKGNGE